MGEGDKYGLFRFFFGFVLFLVFSVGCFVVLGVLDGGKGCLGVLYSFGV